MFLRTVRGQKKLWPWPRLLKRLVLVLVLASRPAALALKTLASDCLELAASHRIWPCAVVPTVIGDVIDVFVV